MAACGRNRIGSDAKRKLDGDLRALTAVQPELLGSLCGLGVSNRTGLSWRAGSKTAESTTKSRRTDLRDFVTSWSKKLAQKTRKHKRALQSNRRRNQPAEFMSSSDASVSFWLVQSFSLTLAASATRPHYNILHVLALDLPETPNREPTMNLLHCNSLVLIVLFVTSIAWSEESNRLDREHLLRYQDSERNVHAVKTAADWEKRRAEILRGMEQVMGSLPSNQRRVALNPEVVEESDAGSYVRRLITYQSEPESRTPAYLCIPKDVLAGQRRAPAVLCLHPTDNRVGHKVVVGLGGRAGRGYAAELAERGYVTLSPSYPHLANYWPNLGGLGYVSGTMKAIWDNTRALDLLTSFPYVDASRGFGAIGHSLGGHNAIYTAVFDKRISVLASSCGFDSYLNYYDGDINRWYFGQGWCQIRYMPRMSNYRGQLAEIPFDFHEMLGALAPRPLFVNAPLHDSNFRWRSVDECAAAARPVYALLGGEGNLIVKHPDCDHNFPEELRAGAYKTIDSVLKPTAGP